ncbi:MAG: nitrate ABC transporter, permease protein [Candidatus Dactylopiibacterium carminicum]|uniref:Nitrate ABC transporter, permease protein n=1 Tax=Candidatus Dactylopiibacterium carminicum TaxID=857335 RepID=A0A272ENU7_9RHOO|nr:nitrate ABC transporter permease [Candidatus Dactylopiibacterium carminicum]KAF7599580.1 nitrate ABC transporter, permease protein [Candidatus Dactylopiibacterium carminicum]PAS91781.1 MAG: nitrate ABC transporter, permease protein [Candidatus Dactylopiibacterium carminicum]PAS92669.1 MAG: nitrate ABC transporter, permease protein [Candidatus Dactylopiibacterium carminicum]
MNKPKPWLAPLLSLLLLLLGLAVWHLATHAGESGELAVDPEYAALVGAAATTGQKSSFPGPGEVGAKLWEHLKDPFYDRGTNDKGIGIQIGHSIARVLVGYLLAALIAIPLGFVIGMSPLLHHALDPYIQILKPISPLAWMPLALYTIKDSGISAIFVIFICSIWPMLLNTAFGVASVRRDWLNVARTLEVSRLRTAFQVILPAAAPTIMTGMRISIGIAWLVIVAAEMLVGGTGIGYFVWNEWNNLSITNIFTAILVIGLVGMHFGIERGEFACIIGHSGCGKTSILNVLAGLEEASGGHVIMDGREVRGPALDRGVVFQSHALMPWMTALANVTFGVRSRHPEWSRAQIEAHGTKYLEMVGLGQALHKKPAELSGGMKQRVGIARAFAVEPKMLLLDEPFGALDALTRGTIQDELLKIVQATQQTVFMITHDVDEAILLADKILLMSNGPRAKIAEIVEITLPRSRTRASIHHDPQYYRIRNHLVDFLVNRSKDYADAAQLAGYDPRHPPRVCPGLAEEIPTPHLTAQGA